MWAFKARLEALALQWDKVDDMRVHESVADAIKSVSKGMDISARSVGCVCADRWDRGSTVPRPVTIKHACCVCDGVSVTGRPRLDMSSRRGQARCTKSVVRRSQARFTVRSRCFPRSVKSAHHAWSAAVCELSPRPSWLS